MKCYELRLRETAEIAKAGEYDYFTTTLSISPLKNAAKLNEIGQRLAKEFMVCTDRITVVVNFLRDNESKTLLTLDKNMVHFYTVQY